MSPTRFEVAVFAFFCGYGHWWLLVIEWLVTLAVVAAATYAAARKIQAVYTFMRQACR